MENKKYEVTSNCGDCPKCEISFIDDNSDCQDRNCSEKQVKKYIVKKPEIKPKDMFIGFKEPKKKKKKPQSFGHGGFVDPESPKAQMDKINISIILNMGKESEMNPSDDGNQRDIM